MRVEKIIEKANIKWENFINHISIEQSVFSTSPLAQIVKFPIETPLVRFSCSIETSIDFQCVSHTSTVMRSREKDRKHKKVRLRYE